MSDNGWIKLHRKFLDSDIFANGNLTRFWIWCLLKASHRGYSARVGNQQIDLKAGQFIFKRPAAVEFLGLSEKIIRTCLEQLKMGQQIKVKTTNKFSIVSIVNWDAYQGGDISEGPTKGQQMGQQRANKGPTNDFIPINKQEGKERKEDKEINIYAREGAPISDTQNAKKAKKPTEPKTEYAPAVKMTEAEHDSFIAAYGEACPEMLEILSDYKLSTGKNYKSDRATMNTWVQKEYKKRHPKAVFPKDAGKPQAKKSTGNPFADYALELEEQERKAKPWN